MCPATSDDRASDALTELEFGLSDPEYFFVGLSDDQTCRVRLEEVLRLASGALVEFFTARDCAVDAICDRASRAGGIDSVRIVAEERNEVVFQLDVSGSCVVRTVEGVGGIPESVHALDGSGRIRVQVPRCVDPGDVVEAVCTQHPAARLVARRRRDVSSPAFPPRGTRQWLRTQITDRQWEVLRTAYLNGYFRRPREHTGEEIAEMLDITSATFSQHLRSAQRTLLSNLFDEGLADR